MSLQGKDNTKRQFVYRIDARDRIVAVNDEWVAFALENDAPSLNRQEVLNKPIWSYISDPDTCSIYRIMFDAVRTRGRELTVTYRCDSPVLRRFMTLSCLPLPEDHIELRSRIVRQEERPYVAVLDHRTEHSDLMVILCAWCKKCRVSEDDWREIEDAVNRVDAFRGRRPPQVSHGMCTACHLDKIQSIFPARAKEPEAAVDA